VSRLIINADDFGLTPGVNRAIVELHQAGALTSTTLMARAAATQDAIRLSQSLPLLGVGCHIVLVDGDSALPPASIPTLVHGSNERFPNSLAQFLVRLLTGRISSEEIEAEAAAQIRALQSTGLHLTHIDTHKHTHMLPAVLRPVLRAARAAGIRAVRNPFEPVWAVRATAGASWARAAEVNLLRKLQTTCSRIIAEEGFSTTDGTIAVVGTGVLNAATMRSLLGQLPEGTWELVAHPGYNDADLSKVRTRLRASREIEMKALGEIREFPEIELISYAQLRSEPSFT
jgi:hopanoid biosynthesis associated protein HpnK